MPIQFSRNSSTHDGSTACSADTVPVAARGSERANVIVAGWLRRHAWLDRYAGRPSPLSPRRPLPVLPD